MQFKGGFDDAVRAICIQTFHVKWPFPWQYMSNSLYISPAVHYEKKLTKNIRPTDILQIYTSI